MGVSGWLSGKVFDVCFAFYFTLCTLMRLTSTSDNNTHLDSVYVFSRDHNCVLLHIPWPTGVVSEYYSQGSWDMTGPLITAELSDDNADVIQEVTPNLYVVSAVRYIDKSVSKLQELLNCLFPCSDITLSPLLLNTGGCTRWVTTFACWPHEQVQRKLSLGGTGGVVCSHCGSCASSCFGSSLQCTWNH